MCRCLFYLGPCSSSTEVNYNLPSAMNRVLESYETFIVVCSGSFLRRWSHSMILHVRVKCLLCLYWCQPLHLAMCFTASNKSRLEMGPILSLFVLMFITCLLGGACMAFWSWDLKENQTSVVKNIPFPSFPLSRVVVLHLFLLPIS